MSNVSGVLAAIPYVKNGQVWADVISPAAAPATLSPSGTVVNTIGPTIVTKDGAWSLVAASDPTQGNQVALVGKADPSTYLAAKIGVFQGMLFQKNVAGGVWSATVANGAVTWSAAPDPFAPAPVAATLPTSTNVAVPALAVAHGMTAKVVSEGFKDLSAVDINGTGHLGNGVVFTTEAPFGWPTTPSKDITLLPGGGLRIAGPPSPSESAVITVATDGKGGFIGATVKAAFYVGITLQFDPTETANLAAGTWIAAWLLSAKHIYGGQQTKVGEIDIVEYLAGAYGLKIGQYAATTHDEDTSAGFKNVAQSEHTGSGVDGNAHTYSVVNLPPANGQAGTLSYYFDATLVGSDTYQTTGNYSEAATDDFALILGSSEQSPMTVLRVEMWQRP